MSSFLPKDKDVVRRFRRTIRPSTASPVSEPWGTFPKPNCGRDRRMRNEPSSGGLFWQPKSLQVAGNRPVGHTTGKKCD